jgi:ubiquitin carboxyl-terminal hydrolase 4/11/15
VDDENRCAKRHTHTTAPHRPKKKDPYSRGGGYNSGYSTTFSWHRNDMGKPAQRGIVGLRNLGNTCFMNSTIQCLAQSPWLTDYFLDNEYVHHINIKNPLGWGGRVATAWAKLLQDMFSNKYSTIAPRQFKDAIGEVAPRFLGYSQQDSQELLSFLLDGLHEDLNQIENKPSTNAVDSAGREDSIVALESWKQYLRRNQSVIVDYMQGQYRSEVVCPDCKKHSVTFDPYLFLSIPLPTERHKMIEYTFISSDYTIEPMIFAQKMLKVADIDMLKASISSTHGIPKNEVFVCDIWKSKIHRELRRNDAVGDINRISDDIFVFHCPRPEVDADALADYEEKQRIKDEEEAAEETNSNSNHDPYRYRKSDYYAKYLGDPDGITGAGYRYHYNYNAKKKGAKRQPPDLCTFVIINQRRVKAKHIYYANQKKWEDVAMGYPLLITMSNKVPITINQIREKLFTNIKPFMEDQSKNIGDDDLPFKLWATWGFNDQFELKPSDEVFVLRKRNLRFVLHWTDAGQYIMKLYERGKRARDASAPTGGANKSRDDDSRRRQSKPITLQQCLEAFSEKEVLSENDAWYCSQCKGFKCASKKIDLYNSPDLLVIHLKRFSYTRNWRDRINTLVQFPVDNLDLSNYLLDQTAKGDAIYDCYAVSNHMGGMGGGHYTAYARSLENEEEWYQLDDSRTARVHNTQHIVSSAAYVLYYKKKQPRQLKQRASRIDLDLAMQALAEKTKEAEAQKNNNNNSNQGQAAEFENENENENENNANNDNSNPEESGQ